MAKINSNYQKLQAGYLFPEIGKRVRAFASENPSAKIIRLGIGDVVLPLPDPILDAMHKAVDEMGKAETFKGYGPEQGYDFLLNAISAHFKSQGAEVAPDEIFVSDGSTDCGQQRAPDELPVALPDARAEWLDVVDDLRAQGKVCLRLWVPRFI